MGALGVIAIVFISMAVVISVVGQLTTIWDFLGVRRPRLGFPLIAFMGALAFLLLLSALVTIYVVPAGNNLSLANMLAVVAIWGALVANVFAVISLIVDSRQDKPNVPFPRARLLALVLVNAVLITILFGAILFGVVELPFALPYPSAYILGLAFTMLPILYSIRGWQDRVKD